MTVFVLASDGSHALCQTSLSHASNLLCCDSNNARLLSLHDRRLFRDPWVSCVFAFMGTPWEYQTLLASDSIDSVCMLCVLCVSCLFVCVCVNIPADDLNRTHQHCVLAGDTARFSSTHRVAQVRSYQKAAFTFIHSTVTFTPSHLLSISSGPVSPRATKG